MDMEQFCRRISNILGRSRSHDAFFRLDSIAWIGKRAGLSDEVIRGDLKEIVRIAVQRGYSGSLRTIEAFENFYIQAAGDKSSGLFALGRLKFGARRGGPFAKIRERDSHYCGINGCYLPLEDLMRVTEQIVLQQERKAYAPRGTGLTYRQRICGSRTWG